MIKLANEEHKNHCKGFSECCKMEMNFLMGKLWLCVKVNPL